MNAVVCDVHGGNGREVTRGAEVQYHGIRVVGRSVKHKPFHHRVGVRRDYLVVFVWMVTKAMA